MDNAELVKLAKEARSYSGAVISSFMVGAALETSCGKVFLGCNIEDPSGIGVTSICAERCAVVKAISEGYTEFAKIAVVGGPGTPKALRSGGAPSRELEEDLIFCTPCGACRQFLNSYNPELVVVCGYGDNEVRELTIRELLPYSFNEKF